MTLTISNAAARAARPRAVKGCILGPSGIGKTSLLWTLDPATTLVLDAESGLLAVEGWQGFDINVRREAAAHGMHPWDFARAVACLLGGPDPAAPADQPYSGAHHAWCAQTFGDPATLFGHIQTIFVDSITVLSRHAFAWSKTQPDAFNKQGKPDTRGAYGLMGQEMVRFLTQLQHVSDKSVWMVGILEAKEDDVGRKTWGAQVEGGKTMRELPGIFDELISMVEMDFGDAGKHRVFVCHTINEWGYPAKDRSGRLDRIEQPHLGKLMEKMRTAPRHAEMVTTIPTGAPAPAAAPTAQATQEAA